MVCDSSLVLLQSLRRAAGAKALRAFCSPVMLVVAHLKRLVSSIVNDRCCSVHARHFIA